MFGRLLKIDLTNMQYSEINISDDMIRLFIGGKGLGAYLLYTMLPKSVDPLSPGNILMFLTGPLTGTSYPTSGRMVVITKSPLTNLYTDSHAGGYFGPELRRVGFDGIIITGKANKLTYLWITDSKIEFRDALHLRNLTIDETVYKVRKETNENAHVACIGPAGEHLVRFASIGLDRDEDKFRAGIAGRGGVGAVMGSKNLKAIAVYAEKPKTVELYDPDNFKRVAKEAMEKVNNNKFIRIRRQIGTSYWVDLMNSFGYLPSYNFKQGFMEDAVGLYGTYMRDYVKRMVTCYNCPISCGKILERSGKDVKVEYETIALLGSNNGFKDVLDVADAVYLCNNLGLDAISTGNVIGFAMECRERGLLKDAPSFGNKEGQLELIKKIAFREGIGDLLAEGVKRASEKIGGESYKFAMHVKGLEIPGYEPRASWGMALAYATSDRGACHQRVWTVKAELYGILKRFSTEGIAKFVKEVQDERAVAYSLIVCDFTPLDVDDFIKALKYALGFEYSADEYLKIGERIWNLTRVFNIREAGVSRKDDTLPPRVFEEPLPMPPKGEEYIRLKHDDFEKMLDEYYKLRGWDESGRPTPEKLRELSLSNIVGGIL